MTRKILLFLAVFTAGMIADSVLFKLPKLQECYRTTDEIMDVVDYYTLMFTRSLDTCQKIIDDNIALTRRHKELVARNAELFEQCGTRDINIKNDD